MDYTVHDAVGNVVGRITVTAGDRVIVYVYNPANPAGRYLCQFWAPATPPVSSDQTLMWPFKSG